MSTLDQRLAKSFEHLALAALFAFVAWGPLAQGSAFSGGRFGLAVLGILSGGLWLTSTMLARQPRRAFRSTWALVLTALLIWTGISVVQAAATAAAIHQGVLLAGVMLAALAAHGLLNTPARRQNFGIWLLLIAVVMATYVVAQRLGGGFTLRVDPQTLSGFYYHPSHYTGFVTLALPVCVWALFCGPAWPVRLAGLAAGLVLAGSLVFTNSSSLPTALLAGAGAFVLGLWNRNRLLGQVAGLTLLAGVLAGSWLLATPQGHQTLDRLMGGIQTKSVDSFLTERGKLWRMDAQAASAAPVTGVGPGNFVSYITRFRPERTEGPHDLAFNFVNYAHNDYYQLAIELGWTGLALYGLLLGITVFSAPSQDSLGAALLVGLIAVWISGIWDGHATVVPGTMAWAWVACGAVAASRKYLVSDEPASVVSKAAAAYPDRPVVRGPEAGFRAIVPASGGESHE